MMETIEKEKKKGIKVDDKVRQCKYKRYIVKNQQKKINKLRQKRQRKMLN